MKLFITLTSVLLLCSCGTDPGQAQVVGTFNQTEKSSGRFVIIYQGGFPCGQKDYKNNRAIYTITDTKTGIEYIGIEGLGVSSLSHVGKNSNVEQ